MIDSGGQGSGGNQKPGERVKLKMYNDTLIIIWLWSLYIFVDDKKNKVKI